MAQVKTKPKVAETLSIAVFDSGNFPVLSSAFQCTVQTSLDKAQEYCRKVMVDVAFVGKSDAHPSVTSNVVAMSKACTSAQIIAMVRDVREAEIAFANGAADCILPDELNAAYAERRAQFVHARSRYLRQGGDWQLYTHNDLAAIARVLSHDIRNSLSGIVLSLEPIRQACGNNAEVKSYLDILDRSSTKLNMVINRFSSATGNIALKPKEENMVDIIRHTVAAFPDDGHKNISILESYGVDEILYSIDRDKFSIAITNLLTNAADAVEGKAGGEISISVDLVDHDAVIVIEDNGHGVDFTTLQNMFRPFFTTRPGKAGLGLPMAQSIIHAHGGSLRIESSNGQGTKVTCVFPVRK